MTVFRDSNALLLWAYAIEQTPILSLMEYERAALGASGTDKSADGAPSVHDRHAQAAMVRRFVEDMPELLTAYAWASYSWADHERKGGNHVLSEHLATETGIVNGHMRFMLMRRHIELGQPRSLTYERIAEKVGVHERTVRRYEPKVRAAMDAVAGRFFERADRYFGDVGLIRR